MIKDLDLLFAVSSYYTFKVYGLRFLSYMSLLINDTTVQYRVSLYKKMNFDVFVPYT